MGALTLFAAFVVIAPLLAMLAEVYVVYKTETK
jgi:hypothetical protein